MGQAVADQTVQHFGQNNKMNVRNIKSVSRDHLGLSVRMHRPSRRCSTQRAFHCLGRCVVQPCVESIKKK